MARKARWGARQLVTRSTRFSPISFTVSTPSLTAVVACCATSFTTRVTRAIGLDVLFFFAAETAFFAERFALVTAFLALFFAVATFLLTVPTFFFAVATFFFALRFALAIVADARFFTAGRLAPFFAVLLPDFPRDFLARFCHHASPRSR